MRDHLYWLKLAEDDEKCVRNELAAEDKAWAAIAFHADLAAEKYLKAFLAFHAMNPKRTHDLNSLLEHATSFDPTLVTIKQDCIDLSYYAIDSRYPEIPEEYNERVGTGAVESMKRICSAIRERLPK